MTQERNLQPAAAIHRSIFTALDDAYLRAIEAIRQLDLPDELPQDSDALAESNPDLHLLVSYACFCDLAIRDLKDGGLSECPDTYEAFRTNDFPQLVAVNADE